jgi:hypothetical protein
MNDLKISDIENYDASSHTVRPKPPGEPGPVPHPRDTLLPEPYSYREGLAAARQNHYPDSPRNESPRNDPENNMEEKDEPCSSNSSLIPPERMNEKYQPSSKFEYREEDRSVSGEDGVENNRGKSSVTVIKREVFNPSEWQDVRLPNLPNSVSPAVTTTRPLLLKPNVETMEELEDKNMFESVFGTGSWMHQAEADIRSMNIEEFHDVPVGQRIPGEATSLIGGKWQSDTRQCAGGSNQATRGSRTNIPPTSTDWDPNGSGMGSGPPNDGSKGHKRLSGGGRAGDDEDDEDLGSTKKVKVENVLAKGFACPFLKHDPRAFRLCLTHSRKDILRAEGGWTDFSRLK